MKEIHGMKHSETIGSTENLIDLLIQQDRFDKVESLMQEYEIEFEDSNTDSSDGGWLQLLFRKLFARHLIN